MTALGEEIGTLVAQEGPITVERYMALCLAHPVHGYYMTCDPIGPAGDFITAPEISQMFGELIGLWLAENWTRMGSPSPVAVIELGPGRGTLMIDALRAARIVPGFLAAAQIHLVETSPVLRRLQAERLKASPSPVAWHTDLASVPAMPSLVVANEFLDALPIQQFVRTERGWCERLVGLRDGALVFGVAAEPEAALADRGGSAAPGTVLEGPAAALAATSALARRLAAQGGAALLIDYGYEGPAFGDTLQAVKRHAYADPLAEPGEADITVHVDFARQAEAARAQGATVFGPVTQGAFLQALGIRHRAAALKAGATPAQAEAIDAALARLTGDGKDEMGSLFRVLGLAGPGLPDLPGF